MQKNKEKKYSRQACPVLLIPCLVAWGLWPVLPGCLVGCQSLAGGCQPLGLLGDTVLSKWHQRELKEGGGGGLHATLEFHAELIQTLCRRWWAELCIKAPARGSAPGRQVGG